MRPDIAVLDPLRYSARQRCYMYEWMREAVERGDMETATVIREQVKAMDPSLRRCPRCGHPGGLIHCPKCHSGG